MSTFYGPVHCSGAGDVCLFVQEKDFVHMESQQPGQFHGQGQGGVVFVVLDGDDGLPADPQHLGQIFLPEACLLAQLFDVVPHGRLHPQQQDARRQHKGSQRSGCPQDLGGPVGLRGFLIPADHFLFEQKL